MDPLALDYGHYVLTRDGEQILNTADLDEVERILRGES